MKYGIREICDVVFKAKADTVIGRTTYKKGQPVLYIDSAKTSTLEGTAETVYATGGRGNTRLLTWEGEKTLTFTVEDALLSPISLAVLTGAGLFQDAVQEVHVHDTATAYVGADGTIDLTDALATDEKIDADAPLFVSVTEADGSLTGELITSLAVDAAGKKLTGAQSASGKVVFVDFYIVKKSANVPEIQIDGSHFGGFYYVEANTFFRRQHDGVDAPAQLTLPNVKVQSNFTFQMASTGDPSTFSFKMDAMPGYTMFDRTKKVLCVIQVVEDAKAGSETRHGVMKNQAGFEIPETTVDSTTATGEV